MAKVFTILLIWIYALSATGATVHLHYCCGKLQKLALLDEQKPGHDDCPLCLKHHAAEGKPAQQPSKTCCTENSCVIDDAPKGSCQNVKVDAKKTTTDHLTNADKKSPKIQPLELLVFTLIHVLDLPLDTHALTPSATDSPPDETTPLFIQHCTYLI